MSLKLFLSPISQEVYQTLEQHDLLGNHISYFSKNFPDYKNAKVALIGFENNPTDEANIKNPSNEIRKKLYRLKKGANEYKIVDLGNLQHGINEEETIFRLREVCAAVMQKNVLPIIIGGSHKYTFGQYLSYEVLEKIVTLLTVDSLVDINTQNNDVISNENFLHKILLHSSNYLFNLILLGYQSYLVSQSNLSLIEKLNFDYYRLGQFKSDISEIEPIIREANLISFDISAIKSSDAPANNNATPFGFTGEEACQMCWYAGLNEQLTSIGFYEYNPSLDDPHQKTASVIATMIWYFIEGFHNRKLERNFKESNYVKYIVSIAEKLETIVFYKNTLSEKWWMEIPTSLDEQYAKKLHIPCSYSDFQTAQNGEIPERWIRAHVKHL